MTLEEPKRNAAETNAVIQVLPCPWCNNKPLITKGRYCADDDYVQCTTQGCSLIGIRFGISNWNDRQEVYDTHISFHPDAIKEHFDDDEEMSARISKISAVSLAKAADDFLLQSDEIWEVFHRVCVEIVSMAEEIEQQKK